MNITLRAHIHQQQLILDESLPASLPEGEVMVHITPAGSQYRGQTSPRELAQPASGFVRSVLLDPAEDVWQND